MERACLPNNKTGLLILIKVLEMVCVIVNIAAAIFTCDRNNIDLADYLVLLNYCNNIVACTWINKHCKYSMIGRRLARLFVALLMMKKIGIQAEWISTKLNVILDDISWLKKENKDGDFNYTNLNLTYPMLQPCCQF